MKPESAARRSKAAWALPLAIGALVALRMLLLRYESLIRGLSPGCFFRKFTGLNCAGCGGTRAFYALLKGDPALAWRMNPLFLVALSTGLLFGMLAILDRTPWGRPRYCEWIRFTAGVGWLALGIVMVFWVVRNIPYWPFTLLSPP